MIENFPEITINYSNPVAAADRIKICCSEDINSYLLEQWNDIEYRESVYAVFLNRANQVLGYLLVSKGGISSTIVDVKMILQAALKACSTSIILSHNHPSGNLKASAEDIKVTTKLKDGARILDLCLLDHLILTNEGYLSLADDGLM